MTIHTKLRTTLSFHCRPKNITVFLSKFVQRTYSEGSDDRSIQSFLCRQSRCSKVKPQSASRIIPYIRLSQNLADAKVTEPFLCTMILQIVFLSRIITSELACGSGQWMKRGVFPPTSPHKQQRGTLFASSRLPVSTVCCAQQSVEPCYRKIYSVPARRAVQGAPYYRY